MIGGLLRFAPRRFAVGALLWMPVSVLPLLSGLLLRELFDGIGGDRPAAAGAALWLCAAFVGVEVVRGAVTVVAWAYGVWWWDMAATLIRTNALRSILTARGPAATRLPHSTGEAVGRFRDDVSEVVELTDEFVPLAGAVLFAIPAVAIMASVDPLITLVLAVPMVAIGVLSRAMGATIRRLHTRARRLGAAVTAYVGEVFEGVLAIGTAGAEPAVLDRLRELNRRRRDAAVKDRLATDMLDAATRSTVEIGVGLVLLLGAGAMRRGDFTVGDLALFTGYIGWLTALPQVMGGLLYRLPQAAVATERLTRLMAPHEDVRDLVRDSGVRFHRPPDPPGEPPEERLAVLAARGLTVGSALGEVDLRVPRGSFTVITGAVGAGKSTLVRALLGLVPADAGTITWNRRRVDDPGTFMVPGRVAYAGQVPRLFSATLRENLLLGRPEDDDRLAAALELAAFEDDLAGMPEGLDTVVGPRGTRLSGGQIQRVTAARALIRGPELLVVDDLSAALDVETERLLWDRIGDAARDGTGPSTLLVVSHRRAALERADQIVVLDRGRAVGRGTLGDLMETCPEMRRLWAEERLVEAEERTEGPDGAYRPATGPSPGQS